MKRSTGPVQIYIIILDARSCDTLCVIALYELNYCYDKSIDTFRRSFIII